MRYLLIPIIIVFASCGQEPQADEPIISEAAEDVRTEETMRMVDRLQQYINDNYNLEFPYASRVRADYMKDYIRQMEHNDKRVHARMSWAKDMLDSGDSEGAATEFQALLYLANSYQEKSENIPWLKDRLAISYLRKGEQMNCILQHNRESCLFPIHGGGIYVDQEPSKQAIDMYEEILESDKNALSARYLLNLAYMTIGQYPDSVPAEFLITPDAFDSDIEFKNFPNKAVELGIDIRKLSGGCVVDDMDNDGDLDVVATSWGLQHQMRYMVNNGDGSFTDKTNQSGLTGLTSGLNMNQADFDNDGYKDLFVMRGGWFMQSGQIPNSLIRNRGDGTFEDVTESAGLLSLKPTQTSAWGDFNNDGWLDLFVGNESMVPGNHNLTGGAIEVDLPNPCALYLNKQDGTFEDVAPALGMDVLGFIKGCSWGDYNNDGLLDLYVTDITGNNLLFKNQGANDKAEWSFKEVAKEAGVQKHKFSFATWFWDYDNDGWLDLFVAGYPIDRYAQAGADAASEYLGLPTQAQTPALYHNNGDGTFTDLSKKMGIDKPLYVMGSNFGDLDNDGYLDMYLGTGDPDYNSIVPNRMFKNDGGKRFLDVTTAGGFGHIQKGHGVAFADIDNDGDQDVYAVLGGAAEGDVFQNALFENPGFENHWITLQLEGVNSNKDALGSRIKISVTTENGNREIHSMVSSGGSFGSSAIQQEIGLGKAIAITEIEVKWHGGAVQKFSNFEMDQFYKLTENKVEAIRIQRAKIEL